MSPPHLWSFEILSSQSFSHDTLRQHARGLAIRLTRQHLQTVGKSLRAEACFIRSRCANGRARRPIAFVESASQSENGSTEPNNRVHHALRLRLSISHIQGCVAAAVSARRIGIDVVDDRVSLPASFQQTWFDESERHWMRGDSPQVFWAAKEAAYKAFCRRQPFRPHDWKISFHTTASDNWSDNDHAQRCQTIQVTSSRGDQPMIAEVTIHSVSHYRIAVAERHRSATIDAPFSRFNSPLQTA